MRRWTVLILCLTALPAYGAQWRLLTGSTFGFIVSFEGATMPGDFARFDVALEFDGASPEKGCLKVTVDLAAADMGDAEVNGIIADPVWFGSAEFPRAVFESDSIAAGVGEQYVASGVLDLKGVRKPVAVPFTWSQSNGTATMRGAFIIKRTDFDVGSGEWSTGDAIGLDVSLAFDVRLERAE